jgi:hypothetical protein
LVVALLAWTIGRPSAALWVGVATSIKLAPILFVAGWVGLGRWRSAVIAIATGAVLFAPMLLFDLSGYVTNPGTGLVSTYAASPVIWAVTATGALLAIAWLVWRGSPHAFIAAGVAMFLVPPRVSTAYLAFLIPSVVATLHALDERRASVAAPSTEPMVHGQRI